MLGQPRRGIGNGTLSNYYAHAARAYAGLGKTKEAVDLLFSIADNARKAKTPDGKPQPKSAAARDAEQKLEKLDAARYAQLPPEAASDLPLS